MSFSDNFSKTSHQDASVSKPPGNCTCEYPSLNPINCIVCITFTYCRFQRLSLQVILLHYLDKANILCKGFDFKETREPDDQKSHVSGPPKVHHQPLFNKDHIL